MKNLKQMNFFEHPLPEDPFELLLPEMTRKELEDHLREYYKINLELRAKLIDLEIPKPVKKLNKK